MRPSLILLILVVAGACMRIFIGTSKIWTSQGVAISAGVGDESNANECSVIYEAGAQILTGTVYKMWWRGGWSTVSQLNYAESSDGLSWTQYGSNPVLADVMYPHVFKDGSTYYLYAVPKATTGQINLWTSSDGISWTLDTEAVLSKGAGGQWDDGSVIGNNFVWKESANDWRMMYEAHTGSGAWKIGYATSSDGRSWSKSGSNPVVSETGSVGGPFVYKNGANDYWMWVQSSASGFLPTDLSRYTSANLTSWTRTPPGLVLTRYGTDEGATTQVGQIADIVMLTVGGETWAWMAANTDGSQASGHSAIKFLKARVPMSQLIYTNEGY